MKKQGKGSRSAKRKNKPGAASQSAQASTIDRRSFVNKVVWGAAGVAVLGGAAFYGTKSIAGKVAEQDLSRMGKGVPSVVQIHDPQCPNCTALQRQTRRALSDFGEDEIIYLVADIKTQQGQIFAGRFGVPHVTLLLFDANGSLVQTLQGVRQADELRATFERLAQTS